MDTEETAENRKASKRRDKVLFVRLSEDELRQCKLAANDADVTTGEWARAALVDLAESNAKLRRRRRAESKS